MKQRCYCKHSKVYPICDGTHSQEGWSCKVSEKPDLKLVFSASPSSFNLARKAAHHFDGESLLNIRQRLQGETFVYLCDGSNYTHFEDCVNKVETSRKVFINLTDYLPFPRLEGWTLGNIHRDEMHPLMELEKILNDFDKSQHATDLGRIFVSHAVGDEEVLEPAIRKLRKSLDWEIFLCGDSIQNGPWFEQIEHHLRNCDSYLFVVSSKSVESVFCAFESGYATALKKPCAIVSLDGCMPPKYLQHLQVFDCSRLAMQKPWLNSQETLIDCIFQALDSI